MKILETELNIKGGHYRQVVRSGDFAIYGRYHPGAKDYYQYEVIRIRSHNGYSIAGNDILPAESYPPTSAWGKDAFTCVTEDRAREKLKEMQEKQLAADLNPVKRGRKPGAK